MVYHSNLLIAAIAILATQDVLYAQKTDSTLVNDVILAESDTNEVLASSDPINTKLSGEKCTSGIVRLASPTNRADIGWFDSDTYRNQLAIQKLDDLW